MSTDTKAPWEPGYLIKEGTDEKASTVTFKNPPKDHNPLHKIHEKIIYASRKGRTAKEVNGILSIEIEWFLRQNPGYFFEKMVNPTPPKNADQSYTFTLQFQRNL